jgi:flagellar hook-associated protein 3 FlgL
MSVDRVATSTQSSYLTSQMLKSEAKVAKYADQTATGQKSTSYTDYGDQTLAMESARAVVNRTTGYQTATSLATTQTELQDNQLTQISTLASSLKDAIAEAVATNDGSTLKDTASNTLDQVAAILNYRDSNGSYLYGGGNDSSAPFTVASFADLASTSLADAFANGSTVKSVQVSDSETIDIGLTASDVGTDLMTTLKELSSYIADNGDFGTTLTADQSSFLTGEISSAANAYSSINHTTALNGFAANQLETAADTQTTMMTLYKGFVSNIQDVDMAEAASNLTSAQTALQAVVQVTSTLNSVSLLDYLD